MGTIRNGGNGAFSGKAGSFIGSNWRDINYIKGIPRISNKPKTQKQLEQQAKFAVAVRFLRPVKKQVEEGFSKIKQGHRTSYNVALQQILNNAITGVYPDYTIDYPFAAFSQGPLSGLLGVVILPEAGNLALSWSTAVELANSFSDDIVNILVYEPESANYVIGPPSVERGMGTADIAMPAEWVGKTVHVFVSCKSLEKGAVSDSSYAGAATVI
ncbi:MAG: DUF6266 family protein [Daejeonella sp.]